MCEAHAYIKGEGQEELVMESVDLIESEDGGVKLISIFGEQKFLNAHISALSLVDHKIFLTPNP